MHYLEVLRDEVGFDNLKKAVKNPLTGKKIAAYYGCLLLRPSKALQMGEVEGAMSGLSIAVAGVLTAVLCPLFVGLIH